MQSYISSSTTPVVSTCTKPGGEEHVEGEEYVEGGGAGPRGLTWEEIKYFYNAMPVKSTPTNQV